MDKKYGRVVKIMAVSLISGMILSSCTFGSSLRKIEDDGAVAEKKFERILSAIERKDKDKLKSLFSNKALREAEDIDENAAYAFNLFQGNVQSWELDTGPITSENVENGNKRKEIKVWFNIKTDRENYILFFIDYPLDDFDSDNVGLYTLRIVKEQDKKGQLTYWQHMKIAGVYKPEEE
jgi:hypothetical protein